MSSPRMLVIGHDATPETVLVQSGTLRAWALERGVEVVPGVAGTELPDPRTVDAVAVLGSRDGAWDDAVPWLASEIAYLESVIEADTPILGICFGGQILARVLGGTVHPAAGLQENGWYEITTAAPDVVAAGPWMEFHFDTFTAPPQAEVLASSANCDQAFRCGPHVGVQFHPEVTPESYELWAARWAGTPFEDELMPRLGITTAGLRARTAENAPASRVASWVLYDDFATRAGLLAASPAGAA